MISENSFFNIILVLILAFSATDLELGAEPMGWNGEINGQKAESGVYVYYAQVEFIDRVVLQFEGSITLIR